MTTYLQGHHDGVLRSHRWRTAENSCGYRGLCRSDELPEVASGWRTWAAADDGWFAVSTASFCAG